MEKKPAFSAAVIEALNEDNYLDWSVQLKTYLMAQDLWEIVESTSEPPAPENEAAFKALSKTNAMALHVIQMSCEPRTFSDIREISSARVAWDTLAEKHKPKLRSSEEVEELSDSSAKSGESDKKGNIDDGVEIYMDLYKSLQIGDWNAAKEFLNRHPHAISAKITANDQTALHVAAEAGHERIVEGLVEQMSEENLKIKDIYGFTALARAAYNGNYPIAECMLGKNESLISIGNDDGNIPVVLALFNGHLKLARYLYLLTPLEILKQENGTMGATVVCEAICNKALDIALDLVKRFPRLVVAQDRFDESPMFALARMPDYFLSGNQLVFWKRWIYSRLSSSSRLVSNLQTLLGIKHLYEMKLTHFQSQELLFHMKDQISISNFQQRKIGLVPDAILRATKEGIFEFVFEMVKSNPELVWSHDEMSSSIFSVAVQYRQAKIFSLIYALNMKNSLASGTDSYYNNNLIHMAGMFIDSTLHEHIPGAALLMQRELQWFQVISLTLNFLDYRYTIIVPILSPLNEFLSPKQ